ncbi:MAG: hypothetical protein JNL38_11410 [Myxococcales bacterium]|nr:hypothetical protein [Myxococcales bacterium]
MRNIAASILVPSLFLFACGSSSGDGGGPLAGPQAPGASTSPPPGAPPPASEEPSCPTTTSGPTRHSGDVAGDAVWTAAASPHVVTADVLVRDGASLTIEPCAEVVMAKGAHLLVAFPGTSAGALRAEGTAKRPIRVRGDGGARWASLHVHAPGTARLAHVSFEGGGGGDFEDGVTVHAVGVGDGHPAPILAVDHVTVSGSLGSGVWMERGAAFVDGSRELVVRGAGAEPMIVSEHAVGTLPTGSYVGNGADRVLLVPEGGPAAGQGLQDDATIRDRGVPYLVGRGERSNLVIGGRPDGKLVTLTVLAGVTLQMRRGSAIKVQAFTSAAPSTAALRVLGSATSPVVFTSAEATPAPGDWVGVWYGGAPGDTNAIEHARIEYAGGDCGCILATCSAVASHAAAILLTAPPASAFVRDTKVIASAGHGVSRGYVGAAVDFRPTNDFGVAGCAQTLPSAASCPSPKPACE